MMLTRSPLSLAWTLVRSVTILGRNIGDLFAVAQVGDATGRVN